jgi:uncharacterized membrane protein (DUF4010 family)
VSESPELAPFDLAQRIGLALVMALFMGFAFEGVYKRAERSSPGGIRTFPLLASTGTVLYLLEPHTLLPYTVGLAVLGIWLYAHQRPSPMPGQHPDAPNGSPSLVVPTANLLAYGLGPIALSRPAWLVVAITVAAVLLLEGREALHRLALRVPADEVLTLGKFLILVGVVLPLLPNHPIVTWTRITPFQVWLALVAISSLSYLSYLLQRYLPRAGLLWPALLGGAYSSTATTVALSREQGALPAPHPELSAAIVLATAVMYVRLAVVIAIFNVPLALTLLPTLAALCALAALLAGWLWTRRAPQAAVSHAQLAPANPLQLGTAATFATLFVLLSLAASWVSTHFGRDAVYGLAFLTGLTDIDPFVLSLAQGGVPGMGVRAVAVAVLIAAASNNFLKAGYSLAFGRRRCRNPALALVTLGVAGLLAPLAYLL